MSIAVSIFDIIGPRLTGTDTDSGTLQKLRVRGRRLTHSAQAHTPCTSAPSAFAERVHTVLCASQVLRVVRALRLLKLVRLRTAHGALPHRAPCTGWHC